MAATWLLLGWQAHVPLATTHVMGIGLGLVAAAVGVLVGRWLALPPVGAVRPLSKALLRKQRKVFLLLLGALLLWPREAVLGPWPLTVALLAALATMFILRTMLHGVLGLLGIEIRQPEASEVDDIGAL
jgi:hypothetical protein